MGNVASRLNLVARGLDARVLEREFVDVDTDAGGTATPLRLIDRPVEGMSGGLTVAELIEPGHRNWASTSARGTTSTPAYRVSTARRRPNCTACSPTRSTCSATGSTPGAPRWRPAASPPSVPPSQLACMSERSVSSRVCARTSPSSVVSPATSSSTAHDSALDLSTPHRWPTPARRPCCEAASSPRRAPTTCSPSICRPPGCAEPSTSSMASARANS